MARRVKQCEVCGRDTRNKDGLCNDHRPIDDAEDRQDYDRLDQRTAHDSYHGDHSDDT